MNENERGTFAAHLPCGCQWCGLHYGDQAPTSDELEIWKLKNQIAETAAEVTRLKAEYLADLKEKRVEIDNQKTWVVALFAHVCRLTGKDPKDAPREILEIASRWRSGKVEAAAAEEREACARVADEFDFGDDIDSSISDGIAAAIRARGAK